MRTPDRAVPAYEATLRLGPHHLQGRVAQRRDAFSSAVVAFGLAAHFDDDELTEAITEVVNRVLDERQEAEPSGPDSPWMTIAEASAYLRCPASYLYDGRSNGRFTPHKRGSRAILDRAEIEAHARGDLFPARRTQGRPG